LPRTAVFAHRHYDLGKSDVSRRQAAPQGTAENSQLKEKMLKELPAWPSPTRLARSNNDEQYESNVVRPTYGL